MRLIAVFAAEQGIKLMIGVQCVDISNLDRHPAALHPWAGDLDQTGGDAFPMMCEIVEPLTDQVVGRKVVEVHGAQHTLKAG